MYGLDQEQPDSNHFGSLKQALQNGTVSQSPLDDMVHRVPARPVRSGNL
jgi:hypothetical protein